MCLFITGCYAGRASLADINTAGAPYGIELVPAEGRDFEDARPDETCFAKSGTCDCRTVLGSAIRENMNPRGKTEPATEGPSVTQWLDFLRAVMGMKTVKRFGLLLRWEGDTPRQPVSRETVNIADLDESLLLHLPENTLTVFRPDYESQYMHA